MTRPAEKLSRILDGILAEHDLSHDFGRRQAWEAVIDHARAELKEDPDCDAFLETAAERLGFATISAEDLDHRIRLPKGAWLDVWISDEDEEVAITGTSDGIQYLIDLLTSLRSSKEPSEHLHLDRAFLPMTENSANLVLFKEEEQWFTGPLEKGEPYPPREIEPKSIYAIQFIHFPPDDLPMTANRLYRVIRCEAVADSESTGLKEFSEGSSDRYYRFTFVADTGERFSYVFHLDDPGVNFFTHREIVSLALKPV